MMPTREQVWQTLHVALPAMIPDASHIARAADAVLALFKAAEAAEPERCVHPYLGGECGTPRDNHRAPGDGISPEAHHAFVAPKPEARESEGKPKIIVCRNCAPHVQHGYAKCPACDCIGTFRGEPQEPERVIDQLAIAKAALAKYEYDGPILVAVRALIAWAEERESPTLTHRECAIIKAITINADTPMTKDRRRRCTIEDAERALRGES